jgi:hypothetical protein
MKKAKRVVCGDRVDNGMASWKIGRRMWYKSGTEGVKRHMLLIAVGRYWMGGLGFNKGDVDGFEKFACGHAMNPIAKAVIATPDEHAAHVFFHGIHTQAIGLQRRRRT